MRLKKKRVEFIYFLIRYELFNDSQWKKIRKKKMTHQLRVFLTFWRFDMNNSKNAIVLLTLTYFYNKTTFDNGTQNPWFVRSKPLGFSQFLNGNRCASTQSTVRRSRRWPPFQRTNYSIGSWQRFFLVHLNTELRTMNGLLISTNNVVFPPKASDQHSAVSSEVRKCFVV